MPKLTWDNIGEHFYETGVKQGVIYPWDSSANKYGVGAAWNGLTAVNESPSGAEATALYADNIKYLNLYSAEEFSATVEAYTYPDEFAECDGSAEIAPGITIGQQARKSFAMCYRTEVGNDTDGNAHGYKLHVIYGARVSPSAKNYTSINDSPEAISFSWEMSSTPVNVSGKNPTATMIIDSTKTDEDAMRKIEEAFYGVDADEYDSTHTYGIGDYCTKAVGGTSTYYRCKAANTTGVWDASKWEEVDAGPHVLLPDEILALIR